MSAEWISHVVRERVREREENHEAVDPATGLRVRIHRYSGSGSWFLSASGELDGEGLTLTATLAGWRPGNDLAAARARCLELAAILHRTGAR